MPCRVRSWGEDKECGEWLIALTPFMSEREHADRARVGSRGGYAGVPKIYTSRLMPCTRNGLA